jgi:hypothetical protein
MTPLHFLPPTESSRMSSKRPYRKPVLKRLGLLRRLTRFSF